MILEGVVLGGITLAGFTVLYKRMPIPVKKFMMKHPIITDCVIVVFFYEVMGMSIIAHVAVAVMSLGVMAGMEVARNPQDYQYLLSRMNFAKNEWAKIMDKLKDKDKQIA